MPGSRKRPPVNRPVFYCDDCAQPILEDNGYLTVVRRTHRNRWSAFHDECRNTASIAESVKGICNPLIVRLSRVSTFPLFLTTMASLASDVIGFEKTNWPTFMARIASDSEWSQSEGCKSVVKLQEEHRLNVTAAFGINR